MSITNSGVKDDAGPTKLQNNLLVLGVLVIVALIALGVIFAVGSILTAIKAGNPVAQAAGAISSRAGDWSPEAWVIAVIAGVAAAVIFGGWLLFQAAKGQVGTVDSRITYSDGDRN